jgi:two-component system CheB/CheR fusion protein
MAEKVLHLIPTDIGRPIAHLQLNAAIPELESMILQVVDTVSIREREVQDREGHWYSLRIRPYRTSDNKIDGAVLLFVDIDSLKNLDRLTQLLEEVDKWRKYADAIVQTVQEPLVILDHALTVRTANRAFYETFQVSPQQTEGCALYSLGNGQWDIRRLRELLAQCISHGIEVRDFDVEQSFETIGARIMRLNARRLEQQGVPEGLILLAIEDITDLKRSLEQTRDALREKELLLRELHHRVKNNLQIVSSLLSLQADRFEEPIVREAFAESQLRIQSMALMHEQLSTSTTLAFIHMQEYVQRLARQLFDAYGLTDRIRLHLDVEDLPITLDTALPCALILTELLTNVLQHAFPAGQQGDVSIIWHAEGEDRQLLMVQDTGIGIAPGTDLTGEDSLGMGIVRALVDQLGGSIQVDHVGGTTVTIRFPSDRA